MTIVGVISDTHGLLRPEAVAYLSDSDRILHAGDVGSPQIIPELEKICPVTAIRGNVDTSAWAEDFPDVETIEIDGKLLYMLHSLDDLDLDPTAARIDVVISGHSHMPKVERRRGVLYLNPGSAGPRRFKLPISLAKLFIDGGDVRAELHEISP